MDTSAPPAYQTETPPNETALAPTSSVQINSSSNISGIRDQIQDNCPTLYHLAYGEKGRKNMTTFRIITYKTQETIHDHPAGMTRAMVVQDYSNSVTVMPFVQGPPAESTEAALKALLEKVEAMIGRRWKQVPEIRRGFHGGAYMPNYLDK